MKKALIYSPYQDVIGGGEVYVFHLVKCLQENQYQVTFAWKDKDMFKRTERNLDINLGNPSVDPRAYRVFTNKSSLWPKHSLTRAHDLVFFVSDGSIPFLFSRNNILHFQVPFPKLSTNLITKLKLLNTTVVYNSHFTKSIIDPQLGIDGQVIHPPINFNLVSARKKTNTILSVGRFTTTMHNKRQDVLVKTFKAMVDKGLTGWKLIVAGSAQEKEGKQLVSKLKSESQNYPIEFQIGVDSIKLASFYEHAKIFWLATGFGVNETQHPEKVEHFGIATAEAMSAGCVPVVIDKGGQKEIVTHNQTGLLFNNIQELTEHTLSLIDQPKLLTKLAKSASHSASQYSHSRFCQEFSQLI